jgi:hypothetical protein
MTSSLHLDVPLHVPARALALFGLRFVPRGPRASVAATTAGASPVFAFPVSVSVVEVPESGDVNTHTSERRLWRPRAAGTMAHRRSGARPRRGAGAARLLLITAVAVLFPPSGGGASDGLTSNLIAVAGAPPGLMDILPHNLLILALSTGIPALAVCGARAARARVAGADVAWSGQEHALMWRLLPAVAVASVAWQFVSLGRTLGGISRSWQVSPVTLITHLAHGPPELTALCLPLAALLTCVPERRRVHLPRVLLMAVGVAVLLLVAAGVVESQVTPGLVTHAVEYSTVVK